MSCITIKDGGGKNGAVKTTPDQRLKTAGIAIQVMHEMARIGLAWAWAAELAAADTTENVVWSMKTTGAVAHSVQGMSLSSAIAGVWYVETGREYSSGGVEVANGRLLVGSPSGSNVTTYAGNDLALTGTAEQLGAFRVAADTPFDPMTVLKTVELQVGQSLAIRFKADSGTPNIYITVSGHCDEPWEEP